MWDWFSFELCQKLFAAIDQLASWLARKSTPRQLAQTAWACGKLGYAAPNLFAEIDQRAKWLVWEGRPQDTAEIAWACAKLLHDAPKKFFAEIDLQSKWLIQVCQPKYIANIAWACAKLGYKPAHLFREIDRRADRFAEEGSTATVSNIAWACGKLMIGAPNYFSMIDRQAKWLIREGKPQHICNSALACAKFNYTAPTLFAEFEHQSKWLVEQFNTQDVSNMAWALATLRYEPPPTFFAEIEQRSDWLCREGSPQAVASVSWAFATLGYEGRTFFASLEQNMGQLVDRGNAQDLCNTCYAIAVLGLSKDFETLLAKLWSRAVELFTVNEGAGFVSLDLCMLVQTQLFAEVNGVTLEQPPEIMLTRMQSALEINDPVTSSSMEEISNLLHGLGVQHDCRVPPVSSLSSEMLCINFACREEKIAIEFNGPLKYLRALGSGKLSSTENGAMKGKRRFLQQLGWTVISIDFRDYNRACNASNEKQWLQEILEAEGVVLSTDHIMDSTIGEHL